MNAVLELLHNNEPLTAQLRGATSRDNAASIIVDAAKQQGKSLSVEEVAGFLAEKPKTNPEPLNEEELEAVSGGRPVCSVVASELCCFTCRTSAIIW